MKRTIRAAETFSLLLAGVVACTIWCVLVAPILAVDAAISLIKERHHGSDT